MAPHRFFLEGRVGAGGALALSPDDLHHAVSVARVRAGEEIVGVEPTGRALLLRVKEASRDRVTVEIVGELPSPQLPDLTVFFGMTTSGKADLVVEKCTELGAARLVPVLTDRGVARPDDDRGRKRAERLARVARAAAAQAQRTTIPVVEPPGSWDAVTSRVSAFDRFLVAWEDAASAPTIARALEGVASQGAVGVLVGPEGGLSGEEVGRLTTAGALTVTLGPTILRAETAAIVATALAAAALTPPISTR